MPKVLTTKELEALEKKVSTQEKTDLDGLINRIADTLCEADPEYIVETFNKICSAGEASLDENNDSVTITWSV